MIKKFLVLSFFVVCAFAAWHFLHKSQPVLPTSDIIVAELSEKPLKHLGVIMDGNRRWAKKNGLKPWLGHRKGVEPVRETVRFCLANNIPFLTLYVFSLENLQRPQEELSYLFDVLATEIASKELHDLCKNGVRVNFIGDREKFPVQLHDVIQDLEQKTINGAALTLNLLFCYGGQQEIISGIKAFAHDYKNGTTTLEELTPQTFKNYLWSNNSPAPELVIRTGGDHRLSNFLLFQAAYSELYFLDCYWPEIEQTDLADAVRYYIGCKRNFGK